MGFQVVVVWVVAPCSNTDVSENLAAFIFRVKTKATRFSEKLVSYRIITRRHKPEDHDLKSKRYI
jgi:hypothetical protein